MTERLLIGLFLASLIISISTYLMFFTQLDSLLFVTFLFIGTFGAGFVGGLIDGGTKGERIGISLIACVFGLVVTAIGVERQQLDLNPFGLYLFYYNPLTVLGSLLSWSVERLWEWRSTGYPGTRKEHIQGFATGLAVMTVFLGIAQLVNLTPNLSLAILLCYIFAFAAGFLSGILHGGKPSRRILVAVLAAMVPLTLFAALPPSPVTLGPKALLGLAVYGVVAGLGALLSTR